MPDTTTSTAIEARRREIAAEHLLFGTIRHVAATDPTLLDALEGSIAHLGDHGPADTRDDEAVREIARTFIKSLRSAARV